MKQTFKILGGLGLAVGLSTLVSGCGFLQAPEVEPIPTPVPTPLPDLFNPTDYNTKGVELNKAGDPKLPDYYEVAGFDAPDVLVVRSVDVTKTGVAPNEKEVLNYGAPDRVRLAGVYTARPNSSNPEERRYSPMAMQTVRNWTLGRKLRIEQDSKYPVDLQNFRRVQVFFPGGEGGNQELNLNRMMIRSGFAVVDVLEPTIFDTKGWLNDEEYARQQRLGLWRFIVLQNRQQPPIKTTTSVTVNAAATATGSTPPGEPAPPLP